MVIELEMNNNNEDIRLIFCISKSLMSSSLFSFVRSKRAFRAGSSFVILEKEI